MGHATYEKAKLWGEFGNLPIEPRTVSPGRIEIEGTTSLLVTPGGTFIGIGINTILLGGRGGGSNPIEQEQGGVVNMEQGGTIDIENPDLGGGIPVNVYNRQKQRTAQPQGAVTKGLGYG